MKASDLMIGDWVYIPQDRVCPEIKEPVKVVQVRGESDYIEIDDGTNIYGYDLSTEEVKPIPLTPEILEKNGFDEVKPNHFHLPQLFKDKEYKCSDDSIHVFFTCRGFCLRTKDNLSIALKNGTGINNIPCYVHMLQHALKLCGIEKEIVL